MKQSIIIAILWTFGWLSATANPSSLDNFGHKTITIATDTLPPLQDRLGSFLDGNKNPIDLNDPSTIVQTVEYDPETGMYIITEKIGNDYYRPPTYMTFNQYMDWKAKQQQKDYFNQLAGISSGTDGVSGRLDPIAKFDIKKSLIDRLFGGNTVDISRQGNIDLKFGLDYNKVDNPVLPVTYRKRTVFDFDMDIRMNVTGKIGEKLTLTTNYNTNAVFDFENQMKIDYNSDLFSEDEILKNIEAGNVSLPLKSNLIQGTQNLFGIKTQLQFGKLRLTTILANQKSQRQNISIENGAESQEFEISVDHYDQNKHFLLTHYNRETFDSALDNLPQIKSLFRVLKMEVWITNDRNQIDGGVRDIVALADLGEPQRTTTVTPFPVPKFLDIFGRALPDNNANDLYSYLQANPEKRTIDKVVSALQDGSLGYNFQQVKDFEKVRARKLSPSEYSVNNQLGFVSLRVNVQPDQVVGVAFEYEYNGKTFSVGELSNQTPQGDSLKVLYVKMLKSSTARTDLPLWDLMMKNFYFLGSSQIEREDFRLDIYYDDVKGNGLSSNSGRGEKRFLPTSTLANIPLIRVFNLDSLNVQGDPRPDGVFDYVPGLTITNQSGRIMFPVLEPFGSHLAARLDLAAHPEDSIYVFDELYRTTQFKAKEYFEKNRFLIKGAYRSSGSSSEISLGAFNVPKGSVRVQAGGVQLTEGVDYEVDYNIGKVRILNDAYLQPGQPPINVSFEENTFGAFQQKSMVGLRADYELSKHLNLGATYMHLYEKPYTQKVNVGDDPINNRILGLDLNYSKKAPWLTRLVDKIPLISTKEESTVTVVAEVAALKPGHSKAINQGQKEGIVYIDDFEGSTNSIDLRTPTTNWYMASIPRGMKDTAGVPLFPESEYVNDLNSGVNRALLNWYRLDFTATNDGNGDPYVSTIQRTDIFPNAKIDPTQQRSHIYPLDLHFSPNLRGPYNYDLPNGVMVDGQVISAGVNTDGGQPTLKEPQSRWGGIMRPIRNSDFEAANIEFIDFWMMSPFLPPHETPSNNGALYFQLGNLSEDVLRDSRLFFENGLNPDVDVDETSWSRVPRTQQINYAFDNALRNQQDVGLDGVNDEDERLKYADYVQAFDGTSIYQAINDDPSNDNFVSFRDFDIDEDPLVKYLGYNGQEGNSRATTGKFVESSTNYPNTEDLNRDNSLNETEAYYQYNIPITYGGPGGMLGDTTFVTESIVTDENVRWYHYKIPLNQYSEAVGGIQDFRSIRFLRIVANGFSQDIVFRFGTLELIRNQWRRYSRDILPCPDVEFEVNEVNIEENSSKLPFNYVLPPGVTREDILGTVTAGALQNENSLSMTVKDLCANGEKGIFKTLNMDMRVYKRLQLFVHAETKDETTKEQKVFIRMGKDFTSNYYEYEVPIKFSDPNNLDINDINSYRQEVWPEENFFDFPLSLLTDIKRERNKLGGVDSLTQVDPDHPDNLVTVKGNPNIGRVKTIMIGVKNKDGVVHSMEVWVNELRLRGLDEKGGIAGLARVDLKLADFGSIALSGNYSSIGYGGLDQKLAQRSREQIVQYDLAGNFELGKFLPEKSGVRIPFFAQYSKTIKSPQYDPYDLDVQLKDKIETADDPAEVKSLAQDVTTIKSYNFTNVRKDKTNGKKPKPWDISNFSATYAYSETDRHNPQIAKDNLKRYRGALDYQYSAKTKYTKPFKKVIKKDKYLRFLSEFNFNLIPNSYGVSTSMDRSFNETVYRFAGEDPKLNTYYNKNFIWNRDYSLNWDLSKSLKFSFSAQANSVIDEPEEFDTQGNRHDRSFVRDSIMANIKTLGRMKQYRHNASLNYDVPFKYIPYMDWVKVKASVSADYSWNAGALNVIELGNIAQNGQVRKVNGDLNFTKLYGKSKYLKKIDRNLGGRGRGRSSSKRRGSRLGKKEESKEETGGRGRGKRGRNGRKDAAREDVAIKDVKIDEGLLKDKRDGKAGKKSGKNGKSNAKGKGKGKKGAKGRKKKKKEREPSKMERMLVRPLLSVRKGRVVYLERYASVVPGFTPKSKVLGMNDGFAAPGWDYIAGFSPSDSKLDDFAKNNWITDNVMLNQPLSRNYTQEFNASVNIEPFKDFKIDVDVMRNYTRNQTEMFKDTLPTDNIRDIVHALPRTVGSYTISFFNANTIFNKNSINLFHEFEDNRVAISRRLKVDYYERNGLPVPPDLPIHAIDTGYVEGYGRFQQDVLIPAFLSAYTKTSPDSEQLNIFKVLPRPNWKLTYTGLSKLPAFKALFKSFSLRHGYSSKLTVNSFNTATNYEDETSLNDITYSYYSKFEIPDVVIQEQFSPLVGLDMRMKNDMSLNFAYNKARNLALSFIDYKLAETKTTDVTFGFGYTMKNVEIGFLTPKSQRKKKKKNSKKKKEEKGTKKQGGRRGRQPKAKNLVFKMNFSIRDDVTFNHQIDGASDAVRGTNTFSMSPTIDYNLSKRLTLQLYFDHRRTTPKTSSSPPTVSTSSGITLRFNLGE